MNKPNYQVLKVDNGREIKSWTNGVAFEAEAKTQLENIARLPFIFRHLAVMPDVHVGKGATVGSVIPMKGAVIPSAVGVDIGCGMMAVKTSLNARDLPENLKALRHTIESKVPHGLGTIFRRPKRKHGKPSNAGLRTF
jgi:tRNA-splicing ligase RtcB